MQQTAVVIGAGRTYGQEIMLRLETGGYSVIAIDADDDDHASLSAAYAKAGNIGALIINVPSPRGESRFLELTDAEFRSAMRYALTDVVLAGQAALPYLPRGGRIVHVTTRGYLGAWGGAHVMAGSAGLVAMTRSMALELAEKGIAVNAVAAEFTETGQSSPELRYSVAEAVSYLASAEAGVSGNTLLIDGCRSLRMPESRRQFHPAGRS